MRSAVAAKIGATFRRVVERSDATKSLAPFAVSRKKLRALARRPDIHWAAMLLLRAERAPSLPSYSQTASANASSVILVFCVFRVLGVFGIFYQFWGPLESRLQGFRVLTPENLRMA